MSTEEKPHLSDHVRIENGTIAPPPTPEQEKIVEVPEEIQKIVEELRNLEQVTEQTENSVDQPMDLNEINKEDLIRFDNFDFNLLLL